MLPSSSSSIYFRPFPLVSLLLGKMHCIHVSMSVVLFWHLDASLGNEKWIRFFMFSALHPRLDVRGFVLASWCITRKREMDSILHVFCISISGNQLRPTQQYCIYTFSNSAWTPMLRNHSEQERSVWTNLK
jgi:hypothetical protein